ncbi:hypothetical protein OG203_42875 [Nocardia sp. NBC_01499]|uniref:hypothetical protein n=1 Tax=Nocardia sp. NBC_01499 TaxID=2903597 RepID=UPI003864A399
MNTWRELDPAIRKALMRGEPATDPEIDRIATAHAENALKRSKVWLYVLGIPVCLVVGGLLGYLAAATDTPVSVLVLVIIAGTLGVTVAVSRRKLALIRLLNVSRGSVREPVMPGSSERLEVRVTVAGLLRATAPWLVMVVMLLAVSVLVASPWLTGVVLVVAVPVIAYVGYILVAWALPKHAQLVLDSDGVHTPKSGVSVGWESVREIRVVPLRATSRDPRQVIAFILYEDQVYLRQLPSWQRFLARRNVRTFLSPMVTVDGLADKPIAEIAASAAALSGLPVSMTSPAA